MVGWEQRSCPVCKQSDQTSIISLTHTLHIGHLSHTHALVRAHTLKWIQPSSAHCRDLSRSGSQLTDPITAEVNISSLDLLQPDAALNVFDLRRWVWISSHDNAGGDTWRRETNKWVHAWTAHKYLLTHLHPHTLNFPWGIAWIFEPNLHHKYLECVCACECVRDE